MKRKKEKIKLEIDFYADTFRNGKIEVPIEIAEKLKGDKGNKDDNYWGAIQYLKSRIAYILKIPAWERDYLDKYREECGLNSDEPIQIIAIRKSQ